MPKWIKEYDDTNNKVYRLSSNRSITVEMHLEEMESDDSENKKGYEEFFTVYSARSGRGIPNSPDVFGELNYGSLSMARREAIKAFRKELKQW